MWTFGKFFAADRSHRWRPAQGSGGDQGRLQEGLRGAGRQPFTPQLLARLESYVATLAGAAEVAVQVTAGLWAVLDDFKDGVGARSIAVLQSLVEAYTNCEREFNYSDKPKPYNEAVKDLRKDTYPNKPEAVFEVCRSHASLKTKNDLMCFILAQIRIATVASKTPDEVDSPPPPPSPSALTRSADSLTSLMRMASEDKIDSTSQIRASLNELSGWTDKGYTRILEARMLLIEQEQPSVQLRRAKLAKALASFVDVSGTIESS